MDQPRLAELLASLGVATDLAAGLDMETSARATVLAIDLARDLGIRAEPLRAIYFTAMLRFVGCTSLAAETAQIAGDDLATLGDMIVPDAGSPRDVMKTIVTKVGRTAPSRIDRAKAVGKTLANPAFPKQLAVAHCAQAVALAEHLGAPAETVASLGQIYERFDGKGGPHKLVGEQIALGVRIVQVALRAEIHRRIEGPNAALAVLAQRRNGELDGKLVDRFLETGAARLAKVEGSAWDAVLAAEPEPHVRIDAERVARVAEAFARFADLKSPYTLGHSEAVAARAVAAAEVTGMPAVERERLRIAALLHDLGRVAIPNSIWDKPGGLTTIERERVQEHAAHTAKILARSPLLEAHARLAASDHERLDGTGYSRGSRGSDLSAATNLLAAADVYQAALEERPHRKAYTAEGAARLLTDEAAAGRLDRDAVRAVLTSANAKVDERSTYPCNLTEREVEILRLLAQGLSNKQIGEKLHISPRTAGNHIAHIYEKTGVSTRAAAALFAVQHRLIVA
ncbi:MAG TPA: HD domain-containing phosphohydrolase [Kofleriaceae bacterium]|nr:HD domain-containing phosphohydrolase [Kofleriaceae bacterium]